MSLLLKVLQNTIDTYHIWATSKGNIGDINVPKEYAKLRGIFYNFFLREFLNNPNAKKDFLSESPSRYYLSKRIIPEDFKLKFNIDGTIFGLDISHDTCQYHSISERGIILASLRAACEQINFIPIKATPQDAYLVKSIIASRQAIENFSFKV